MKYACEVEFRCSVLDDRPVICIFTVNAHGTRTAMRKAHIVAGHVEAFMAPQLRYRGASVEPVASANNNNHVTVGADTVRGNLDMWSTDGEWKTLAIFDGKFDVV